MATGLLGTCLLVSLCMSAVMDAISMCCLPYVYWAYGGICSAHDLICGV